MTKNKFENKTIYKVNHYYGRESDVLLIKSDIHLNDLIKVLGAIQFKFEELITDTFPDTSCFPDIERQHILEVLEKFYGVEDVKEEYKECLPHTVKEKDASIKAIHTFLFKNVLIVQVDLYSARENCCGPQYKKIMKEYLPKDDEFEGYFKGKKDFYVQKWEKMFSDHKS